MSLVLNNNDSWELMNEILNILDCSFQDVSQTEPQLIANLVCYFPSILNNFNLSHGRVKFEVGGIFIHQKPYVKNIQNPNNWTKNYVELGDVLLINNIVENGGVKQRKALLLQAKKDSIFHSANLVPDNKDQWDLYANWPKFEYVKSSKQGLQGQIRYIDCQVEWDIFSSAKYLFIDNNSSNSFYCSNIFAHLVGEASVPNLSKFKPLFFELYEFVLGNAGKKFDIQNISPNDIGWNKIIEDLINKIQSVPLSKTIKNHVPKGVSSTRGQGMLFCTNQLPTYGCVINSNLPNLNNVFQQDSNIPPNIPNVNDDGEAEDGAISVVEITTIIER